MDFFKLAQKERSIKKNKSLTICANYSVYNSDPKGLNFFFLVFLLLTILIDEKIHI